MITDERVRVAWLPVRNFTDYEVSNTGIVRHASGAILKQYSSGAGYLKVGFHRNGTRVQRYVHRVVAEAFLGLHDGMQVNHVDGDKHNNWLDNLEWVTKSQNEMHSRYVLGNLCAPITAINTESGEVRNYASQTAAANDLGLSRDSVRKCLSGNRKSSRGWSFSSSAGALAARGAGGGYDLADRIRAIPVPRRGFHEGWRDEEIWEWALREAAELVEHPATAAATATATAGEDARDAARRKFIGDNELVIAGDDRGWWVYDSGSNSAYPSYHPTPNDAIDAAMSDQNKGKV